MSNEDFIRNLGRKIAVTRKENKLSQEEFAEKSGKMINSISKLERGIGNPKIATLIDIANALNISLLDLLNVDDTKNPNYKRSREKTVNKIVGILNQLDESLLKVVLSQISALLEINKKE